MTEGKTNSEHWRERDRAVLWHPFTQHRLWADESFPVIVGGEGCRLVDADGKSYLDGVSSLWLNVHGHRREEIDKAVTEQIGRIAHSTFLGQSHPPGIELAERLIEVVPKGLRRVFYSDDGSTAMEIALKMAYQYWRQQDPPQPESHFFVTIANSYHGDTIGSVSLGGIDLFHRTYRPLIFPTISVPQPFCRGCDADPLGKGRETLGNYPPRTLKAIFGQSAFGLGGTGTEAGLSCEKKEGCLDSIERVLAERVDEIAGVVIEPVMQGAAGMVLQPEGFVRGVYELCEEYGVLMVCDEVATGFGRTGRMFACEHEGVTPDIMAVGKGITGGYLPLAATFTTEEVFEAFLGDTHSENTFFHGHSYTGNQLGCAAALASLGLFEKDKTLENVVARAEQAATWLARIGELAHVAETRQAGLMIGIELEEDPHEMIPYPPENMTGRKVIMAAREKGLIIRPLGDVVILMPPLCVSEKELDSIMEITLESIREVTE